MLTLVERLGGDTQTTEARAAGSRGSRSSTTAAAPTACSACRSACSTSTASRRTKQIEVQKAEQLQDRLPGLLARLPRGRDPLPEVQGRPDQRRRGQRGRPRSREDEGRHLGAARRRHLRRAAPAQPARAEPLRARARRQARARGAASGAWRSCSRRSTSPPRCSARCRRLDQIRAKGARAAAQRVVMAAAADTLSQTGALLGLGRRMLAETDPRLLWKFAWNFGYKGMRSVQRFKKRAREAASTSRRSSTSRSSTAATCAARAAG